MLYTYAYRFRGFSLGCQPKGFVSHDDSFGDFGSVTYERMLTTKEVEEFELELVGKQCTQCHETKALENFNKDSRATDGRRSNCKACVSSYQRKRYEKMKQEDASPKKEDQPQMSDKVAAIVETIKKYHMQDQDIVKAVELRNAIKEIIGKKPKSVKKFFNKEDVMQFKSDEMKSVLGDDWKPAPHGYVMLNMEQAIEFTEFYIQ